MKPQVLAPEAEMELAQARDYYEERLVGLGDLLLVELEKASARIVNYPEAWAFHYRIFRRPSVDRFPYGIVDTMEENCLGAVAVMHLARRPFYWERRR